MLEKLSALMVEGILDVRPGPVFQDLIDANAGRIDSQVMFDQQLLDVLIDARSPGFDLGANDEHLYNNLLAAGTIQRWRNTGAGGSFEPGGIDIDGNGHPLDTRGGPDRRITIVGPPTEGPRFMHGGLARPGVAFPPLLMLNDWAAHLITGEPMEPSTMASSPRPTRRAQIDDAASIARVHVSSWQVGYRDILPAAFLSGLDANARTEFWKDVLTAQDWPRRGTITSATDDGQIVGFASIRAGEAAEHGRRNGELAALYVDPNHWRRGVGSDLMAGALSALVDGGYTHACLWVLEANERARDFYEATGWIADGTSREDDTAGLELCEVRYEIVPAEHAAR